MRLLHTTSGGQGLHLPPPSLTSPSRRSASGIVGWRATCPQHQCTARRTLSHTEMASHRGRARNAHFSCVVRASERWLATTEPPTQTLRRWPQPYGGAGSPADKARRDGSKQPAVNRRATSSRSGNDTPNAIRKQEHNNSECPAEPRKEASPAGAEQNPRRVDELPRPGGRRRREQRKWRESSCTRIKCAAMALLAMPALAKEASPHY